MCPYLDRPYKLGLVSSFLAQTVKGLLVVAMMPQFAYGMFSSVNAFILLPDIPIQFSR
jgi:hypothetical protein